MTTPLILKDIPFATFNGASLTASNGLIAALPARAVYLAWQVTYTGSPNPVSVVLEVSIDGTNFVTLDSSTTITGDVKTIAAPTAALFVRGRVVSVTGGTLITMNIVAKSV
jgi:hypothetical protein